MSVVVGYHGVVPGRRTLAVRCVACHAVGAPPLDYAVHLGTPGDAWRCDHCRLALCAAAPHRLTARELGLALEKVASLLVDQRILPSAGRRLVDTRAHEVVAQARPRPYLMRSLLALGLEAAKRLADA